MFVFCYCGHLLKESVVVLLQNVKGVFDAAIRVVLQPPKQKKKKSKAQKACSILWFNWCKETTTYVLRIIFAHNASYLPIYFFLSTWWKLEALFVSMDNSQDLYEKKSIRWFGIGIGNGFSRNLLWSLIVGNALHSCPPFLDYRFRIWFLCINGFEFPIYENGVFLLGRTYIYLYCF